MIKKTMLIVNPIAGRSRLKGSLFDVMDILSKHGHEVTLYITRHKGHATELVLSKASNFDVVVCCGGDGTLNEVVTGLMQLKKRPPLGYIPSGTTNDIASSLHLSHNILSASTCAASGNLFPYDIGSFNDRYFVYIAAFGAFTRVAYSTPQQYKNALGYTAYILEGVKSLTQITPYHLKITYDEGEIDDSFIFGSITNSTSVAGMIKMDSQKVKLNDGKFEVLLIKSPNNLIEFQNIVSRLLRQDFDEKYVRFFHTSHIRIVADKDIPWTIDGENGGISRDADIKNCTKGIEFISNVNK